MRTSTKIFLSAILLTGLCLAYYDWQLKAEFRKGDYTDPYYGYTSLDYRDFDEIELRSSTAINIMVNQGPYKVLEHPQAGQFVVIRQEGKRLIIEAQFTDHFRTVNATHTLFISCPALSTFLTDARYSVRSVNVTDYANWNFWWSPTIIKGFNGDSLTIREDHASTLLLAADHIKRLTATVGGDGPGLTPTNDRKVIELSGAGGGMLIEKDESAREDRVNGPVLAIDEGNHFDSSDLNILGKGRLWVKGTDIRQLTYHLADSAMLTVNGVSARYLNLH